MTTRNDPTQIFREEAADLLATLEKTLLCLEEAPGDRELLDSAFRALHTIKGSGAMFGFQAAASFTHHLENAFDLVRKGQLAPNSTLIGIALAARDHIRTLIEDPESADSAEGERLLALVAEQTGGGASTSDKALTPADASPQTTATWRIRFRLSPEALERGANPLLLLEELSGLGSATVVPLVEAVPPLEEIDVNRCYLSWDVVLTTDQPRTRIEDVFIFVTDDIELKIEQVGPDSERIGEILVARGDIASAELAEAVANQPKLGQMLVQEGAVSEDKLRAALAEQKHLRNETEPLKAAAQASSSIRVPAERLDDLMDQVGELVIAHARLKQLVAASADLQIKSVTEEIERLANNLRDTTMGIRMVPVETLFSRFRRLVRDLSHDLNKQVSLTMSGEETELDKTMIERLNDPLIHIIRNSLDHGLEPVADRQAAGKSEDGHIHLTARHAGTQVMISIRDDGRGLDRDRIRAKAEEQELVQPGVKLTDSELFQLIFHPGFSTAKTVTSVSGRGVGMDVVKRTIDSLRGTIDVSSTPGHGTEIILSLPLTLAIIDGLLVRVGKDRYVIPLSAVEECVELSADENQRHQGRNFLNIRDSLVPYMRLRETFSTTYPDELYPKVVIISTGERQVGLVVDQVIGEHQTVIKSLSPLHAEVENFSGATILGDGSVALILDVGHLVESGHCPDLQAAS